MFILANSADTDETLCFAAFRLCLRCFYTFLFRMHSACSTLKFRLATPMLVFGLVVCGSLTQTISTLVNVYADLLGFTRIAGTS